MDYENGRTEYEGKIIYNGMEYEFEIDSIGQIVGWEEKGKTAYFAECYILRNMYAYFFV